MEKSLEVQPFELEYLYLQDYYESVPSPTNSEQFTIFNLGFNDNQETTCIILD